MPLMSGKSLFANLAEIGLDRNQSVPISRPALALALHFALQEVVRREDCGCQGLCGQSDCCGEV